MSQTVLIQTIQFSIIIVLFTHSKIQFSFGYVFRLSFCLYS